MEYVLFCIYFLLLLFCIFKWKFFQLEAFQVKYIALLFVLKFVAGIVLWQFYVNYFQGGDLITLFKSGKDLHALGINKAIASMFRNESPPINAWNYEWEVDYFNNNRLVILLNAFLLYLSRGLYLTHILFFSFLSFIGLLSFIKIFQNKFRSSKLLIFFFLLPTLYLYLSGTTKESIALFALGMFLYFFFQSLRREKKVKSIITALFFMALLLLIKSHLFIALLPVLTAVIYLSLKPLKAYISYLISIVAFMLLVVVIDYSSDGAVAKRIHKRYKHELAAARGGVYLYNNEFYVYINAKEGMRQLTEVGEGKYRINDETAIYKWNLNGSMSDTIFIENTRDTSIYTFYYEYPSANSVLQPLPMDATLSGIIISAPFAFINALFRPHPFEIKNSFQVVASLEILFFILLLTVAIAYSSKKTWLSQEFIFCFITALILLLIIGLSTPITGAIIRHRVFAYLFLYAATFLLLAEGKLGEKLKLR